jgi:hypothetical protein
MCPQKRRLHKLIRGVLIRRPLHNGTFGLVQANAFMSMLSFSVRRKPRRVPLSSFMPATLWLSIDARGAWTIDKPSSSHRGCMCVLHLKQARSTILQIASRASFLRSPFARLGCPYRHKARSPPLGSLDRKRPADEHRTAAFFPVRLAGRKGITE